MKYLITAFLVFGILTVYAQERFPLEKTGDWNIYMGRAPFRFTSRLDSATVMIERTVIRENTIRFANYSITGPVISIMDYYTDPATKERKREGRYIRYQPDGVIDTSGYFKNNQRDGEWLVYDDSAVAVMKIIYENGVVKNTEVLKPLSEAKKKKEAKKCKTCKSAVYRMGDKKGWADYISRNVNITPRFRRLPETRGVTELHARVMFLIDTTGRVEDAYMTKSVEWSVDKRILQTILNGADWIPARKDGVAVKAHRMQPIIIRIAKTDAHTAAAEAPTHDAAAANYF